MVVVDAVRSLAGVSGPVLCALTLALVCWGTLAFVLAEVLPKGLCVIWSDSLLEQPYRVRLASQLFCRLTVVLGCVVPRRDDAR